MDFHFSCRYTTQGSHGSHDSSPRGAAFQVAFQPFTLQVRCICFIFLRGFSGADKLGTNLFELGTVSRSRGICLVSMSQRSESVDSQIAYQFS